MLYSRKYSEVFLVRLVMFGTLTLVKIKYLRVPDTLLDAVKEEQNRAREAGRSARGSHVGGPGGRGLFVFVPFIIGADMSRGS